MAYFLNEELVADSSKQHVHRSPTVEPIWLYDILIVKDSSSSIVSNSPKWKTEEEERVSEKRIVATVELSLQLAFSVVYILCVLGY